MVRAPELERADGLQALELQVGVERLHEAERRANRHPGEPRGRVPDVLGADHATFSSSSASPSLSPLPEPSWPWRAPPGHPRLPPPPPRHPPRLPSRPGPPPPPDPPPHRS